MASGIQFRYNETEKKGAKKYVLKRLNRIIYPYVTLSIIYILIELCKIAVKVLIGRPITIENIIGLVKQTCSLWGIGALWFLPTIFFSELLLYVICRFKWRLLFSILIAFFCYSVNDTMVGIFHSDLLNVPDYVFIIGIRILLAYVFEYIGYCMEPIYMRINESHINMMKRILCVCVIAIGLFLVQFNIGVNMRFGYIGNPIIEYLSAAVIMTSIMTLFKDTHNKWIRWLSQNSLLIMGLQSLDVSIAYKFRSLVENTTSTIQVILVCLISLGAFMLVAIPITEFVNRKIPFIFTPIMKDNKI